MNKTLPKSSVVILLHTHMPYVLQHGTWPHGNTWLFEVVLESYIPLLNIINELHEQGLQSHLTLSISPILTEQLSHPEFPALLMQYALEQQVQAGTDIQKFMKYPHAAWNIPMGHYWKEWYSKRIHEFSTMYENSITNALRLLSEKKLIELIPTSVTHAYLPLLQNSNAINLQIGKAISLHEQAYHCKPVAFWLPECGYSPEIPITDLHAVRGIQEYLINNGIRSTILNQTNKVEYSTDNSSIHYLPEHLRPLQLVQLQSTINDEQNLTVFIRHQDLCSKIWGEDIGYPAHADYLDFHKKEYDSSLKYWKVTNLHTGADSKQPYNPERAMQQTSYDAKEFVRELEAHVIAYQQTKNQPGVICLAFDTELFGHWWFEGPKFLLDLIRYISESDYVQMQTLSDAVNIHDHSSTVRSASGSWGKNGNMDSWLNQDTKSIWDAIHNAQTQLDSIVKSGTAFGNHKQHILSLALRELVLMQSSDWTWLISMNTASDYALQRFNDHHSTFDALLTMFVDMGDRETYTEEESQILARIAKRDDTLQEIEIQDWNHPT